MEPGEPFDIQGAYRVQSKRAGKPSRLAGRWATLRSPDLNSAAINACLRSDSEWRGQATVDVRPAFVEVRVGEFENEPDILCKRSHFDRRNNSEDMSSDIIDVLKASARWDGRRHYINKLLGTEALEKIESVIGNITRVAAIEYDMHEAGHCIGYDTASKYRDGYFCVPGKTAWPLVYLEEYRADLLAFGFAASLLPALSAAAVFLYNVLLRFGSHVEGVKLRGQHPYGVIPSLLYASLRRSGFLIAPVNGDGDARLEVTTLDPDAIVDHMRDLDVLARSEAVERPCMSGTDAALRAARFYRSLLDRPIVEEFDRIVECATATPTG